MTAPIRQVDPVSRVLNAVPALLEPYFPPAKWGGPPDIVGMPLTTSMFEEIAQATPRLYLGWSSLDPKGSAARGFAGDLTFSALAVIKANDRRTARLGDRHGPGLYPSLIALVTALHGRAIDDVGTIEVTKAAEQPAEGWSRFGAAAGYVTFTVNTSLGDLLGEGAAADELRAIVSSFDVNPGADPAPDYEPPVDTTVTITLPEAES